MDSKYTKKQKIFEIITLSIWVIWIIIISYTWIVGPIDSESKNTLIGMLIIGVAIYGILSLFTYNPEATNIITSKKYNGKNRLQIIKISRTFFCIIKMIIILGIASTSITIAYKLHVENIIYIVLCIAVIAAFLYMVWSIEK